MKVKIDKIIRSKRRSISFQIKRDSSFIVRAPYGVSEDYIRNLVAEKAEWILRHQEEMKKKASDNPEKKYVTGEKFLVMGKPFYLEVVKPGKVILTLKDKFYLSSDYVSCGKRVFEQWYKVQAKAIVTARAEHYAALTGLRFKRLSVTSAMKRWGSCGPNGSINFSYRLAMAPLDAIDYVVVHELVHLKIRNHSKDFYAEVAKILPDYREREKWLERNGHYLRI